ncbi:MAG: fibronectin type III domain-containing protein, partial [Chloroflexi bacterium]|nr:fibronectin type III domain-containing protein [Chloroflexota bacterium]
MLGSVGSVVPKRWILGIFALGLIAVMVATSANPWADASELPTEVSASASSPTSIQVNWTIADDSSVLPESGAIVDGYRVDCVPTGAGETVSVNVADRTTATQTVTVL